MSGWWIIIDKRTPEERDAAEDKMTHILASWEAYTGGTRWLERLVKEGKAKALKSNGYPCRYVAKAGDIFPLLVDGPPVETDLPTKTCAVTIYRDLIDACHKDQILTIDAWDQS